MSERIAAIDICKQYRLGEYQGDTMIREVLTRFFRDPLGRKTPPEPMIWALKDINFRAREGEIIGIIGRNGAGKSTLLKVLSRITHPTSGSIRVNGRTASLLEVGTGFHEELTGRENIFLNGSIIGMRKREIEARMDEIVAFAGVEKFMDTPIKRYSSGMRMRLGFAVAAHLDADILLVDEVLAVGDSQFQKKCMDTMSQLRTGGRTVLFVSHNMAAVENLCHRVIWIDNGKIQRDGPAAEVLSAYMSTFANARHGGASLEHIGSRTGDGEARFTGVEFLDAHGDPVNYVSSGDHIVIRLHFRAHNVIRDLRVGIEINTEMGLKLAGSNNWATGYYVPCIYPGEGYMDLEIDFLNLIPGRYYLSLFLGPYGHVQDMLENAVIMDVEASDYYGTGRGIDRNFGLVFFPARWKSDCLPLEEGADQLGVEIRE